MTTLARARGASSTTSKRDQLDFVVDSRLSAPERMRREPASDTKVEPLPNEASSHAFGNATSTNTPEPVVVLPPPPAMNYFRSLQSWEGYVESVETDVFVARLVDQSWNDPDEIAEIYLSKVASSDRHLVTPGAVFYWSIGVSNTVSGDLSDQSSIRFRRVPRWAASDIEEAKRDARKLATELGWTGGSANGQHSAEEG